MTTTCIGHIGHSKVTGPACLRPAAQIKPGQNVVLPQPFFGLTKSDGKGGYVKP